MAELPRWPVRLGIWPAELNLIENPEVVIRGKETRHNHIDNFYTMTRTPHAVQMLVRQGPSFYFYFFKMGITLKI